MGAAGCQWAQCYCSARSCEGPLRECVALLLLLCEYHKHTASISALLPHVNRKQKAESRKQKAEGREQKAARVKSGSLRARRPETVCERGSAADSGPQRWACARTARPTRRRTSRPQPRPLALLFPVGRATISAKGRRQRVGRPHLRGCFPVRHSALLDCPAGDQERPQAAGSCESGQI